MASGITTSIVRVALITAGLLAIPLLGNQFVDGWNWSPTDFAVMGAMVFIAGLMLEAVFKKAGTYRILAAAAIVVVFVWLWAELAVGVFTNWGS
jgi:hypothetical protein